MEMNNSKVTDMKAKVISITNHKGGVGKTTTALNLGAALNRLGKKVLVVDMDAQANLTLSLGITEEPQNTIYKNIRGKMEAEPICILPGFDLIPSELDLSGAEVELLEEYLWEQRLKNLLEPLRSKYDYILIDTPPSLGVLTTLSFVAADEVFVILQSQYLALQGLGKLTKVLNMVQKRANNRLKLTGVLITQYDGRKSLNKAIAEQIEGFFKEWKECRVFSTKIRDNVALAEAPIKGVDIFRYAPKSKGAADYLALAEEVISMNKKKR